MVNEAATLIDCGRHRTPVCWPFGPVSWAEVGERAKALPKADHCWRFCSTGVVRELTNVVVGDPDAVALGDAEGDVEVVAEVVAEHVAVAELEIAVFVQAQAADESVAANAKARNTVRVERSSVAAASE